MNGRYDIVSFTCVKRLLVELHYTLIIKQIVIIFKLCIYDYAINGIKQWLFET